MSCEDFLHNNLFKGEYQWQFYAILVLITQTIRQMIEYFHFKFTLTDDSVLSPEEGEFQKFCYDVEATGTDNSDFARCCSGVSEVDL